MRLRFFVLLLVLAVPGEAAASPPRSMPHFPIALTAETLGDSLAFIEPRTLAPYPVPRLALWGLGGLSLLDPALSTEASRGKLSLYSPDRVLAVLPEPGDADAPAWGRAIAALASVAWVDSGRVRALGPDGVIQAFFDELFNHFDPYSRYVPPAEAAEERAARAGRAGTGVTLAALNGGFFVHQVAGGSPAAIAGVHAGERLLSVDGAVTTGKTLSGLNEDLAGADGSTVTLTLADSRGSVRRVALVRRLVPPETVFSSRDGALLVLRISSFDATTGPHLANEIVAGLSVPTPPKGIVLDLRGNRGGLLDQAVYAANVLLGRGVIASTKGRDPAAAHLWQAGGADLSGGLPVVVMVDGRTASAAEILSAALADNGRAVVLGSATLGKGLVQTIGQLPNGGELFVTWSRVLAPRGWPIEGLGVLPEVCTSHGPLWVDRQLSLLAQGVQPMARAIYEHETARAPLPLAQILAIRSACPAAVGSEADMAAARFLIDNPASYAAALLPPPGRPLPPPTR